MKSYLSILFAILFITVGAHRGYSQTTSPVVHPADTTAIRHPEAESISFEIAKPDTTRVKDTTRAKTPAAPTQANHKLPPSILAELRRSERGRAFIYHDTLRANDIAREHLNDSVERQYSDSAHAIVDTAVSLSHKEWLDSELVEIPELSRFGNKVHFEYPSSIMTETDLTAVPFDSTLLSGMNPVTRENLPYFDQSPIPMPLPPPSPMEAFVQVGGGNVYQPMASAWFERALNDRTSINATVDYRNLSGTPIHSFFSGAANVVADLGADPAEDKYSSSDLTVGLSFIRKSLLSAWESNFEPIMFDQTISLFNAEASFAADASSRLHLEASVEEHEWAEEHGTDKVSESSQNISLSLRDDPENTEVRVIGTGSYSVASNASGSTSTGNAAFVNLLIGQPMSDGIEWYLGATLLEGDNFGISLSELRPLVRFRLALNSNWSIGVHSDPQIGLTTYRSLTETNPFAAMYHLHFPDADYDPRGPVMDQINACAFVNYYFSPDNNVEIEGRFITRTHEPVFVAELSTDSVHNEFFVDSHNDLRHIEVSASGNFTPFARDALSASISLMKVDILTTSNIGGEQPFEPTMKADIAYHVNSISSVFFPSVEYRYIARGPDFSTNLLNAEVRIALGQQLSLLLRAENIAGSPSDFWTSYPEYPRSFWASVRYSF